MTNVLIAVPTRGLIHYKIAQALNNLAAQGFEIVYSQSSYGVEAARGRLIKYFLKFPSFSLVFSHLLFIDDDILAPKDIVARLMHHDKFMVSASYPILNDDKVWDSSSVMHGEGFYKRMKFAIGPAMQVDACGLGACLIRRQVLVDCFKPDCLKIDYDNEYEAVKGEDYKLCEAVRAAGYKIYVDFSLRCEHYKTINLEGVI